MIWLNIMYILSKYEALDSSLTNKNHMSRKYTDIKVT